MSNKKISVIAHLADIHIKKLPTRNEEYSEVFNDLYSKLKKAKPDRIVVVGDLVDDYLDLQGEQIILAASFLNSLAEIAPVRVTRGNHDIRKSALSRTDSVQAITSAIANKNIIYYNKTGLYQDENIVWAVWHHRDKVVNPWKVLKDKQLANDLKSPENGLIAVDLFHDPINGCVSETGFEMTSKSYIKTSDFNGEYGMFGDIHKKQFLDKNNKKAYCGSLIAQDFAEGDNDFHGFLLWNVENGSVEEISVHNNHSYKNVEITPYVDFDDLDFEIENPTNFMRIRFIWSTLKQTKSKLNIAKLSEYVKNKYQNIELIAHKNNFVDNTKVINNIDKKKLDNISQQTIQQELFKEYLVKQGCDDKTIEEVIELDAEVTKKLDNRESGSGEWSIVKFGGVNFKSYGKIDIDWHDKDGLYQITGLNARGKSSIIGLISYILYGQTIETESRVKFGDARFVNNRNDASFCEGYCVIEMNQQYFGIKRRTDIKKSKDGSVSSTPTTLKYFLLKSPDDVLDDSTDIGNLSDELKGKTQKLIDQIIGTYDNFHRIISTTSDTLNRVLSNDMAVFIDSLLYDSGLDIFDRKLNEFKEFEKTNKNKTRVYCDIEKTRKSIKDIEEDNNSLSEKIKNYEQELIPEKENKIKIGWEFVEKQNKKLYQIDNEIYNLDVALTKSKISHHQKNVEEILNRETQLKNLIAPLPTSFDANKLNDLTFKKDDYRTKIYDYKLKIKNCEIEINNLTHKIELINGEIFNLKQEGSNKKQEIIKLRESKVCPMCGNDLKPEHQEHINENIKSIEVVMFDIASKITTKQNVDIVNLKALIDEKNKIIDGLNSDIVKTDLEIENMLAEIGVLTNMKNDVQKRNEYETELSNIPIKIQNEELNINILKQKIVNHDNSLLQIEENKKTEAIIVQAKNKIGLLNTELNDLKEDVFIFKTKISNNESKIKADNELIDLFLEQERTDNIYNLYKTCIHRSGIPTQMLVEYIIPKINMTMENILSKSEFNIWLDNVDLRPKLVYNSRPNAVIDCIGASGKERTFSSIILKFSLNQINTKSKPTMFLLDEVMGKLTDESVNEFIEILNLIKENTNKVIIIEHDKSINPDYILSVSIDENGISSVELN